MTFHDPRAVLKAHNLWTKKHFGQNFLIDPSVPDRIAHAGGATASDTIFEIGAGCGTLTRSLAQVAERVIALEYDRDLVPVARAETAWASHVEIREGNVLDIHWPDIADELGGPIIVYGNLPYHLSSKIIFGLLEHPHAWSRACFMLQKEFAERLVAEPGTRQSSALSVQAALWSVNSLLFNVGAQSFHPPPKVESSVVVMERRLEPSADIGDPQDFSRLVRALFSQRRKMARKAIRSIHREPETLFEQAELDGRRRGETVSLDEIARLSRLLGQAD